MPVAIPSDDTIERRTRYVGRLCPAHVDAILGHVELPVVQETHHYDDGSSSETYYLELTAAQYGRLTRDTEDSTR